MIESLTERQRGALYVVAGFALLLNPFVVGALDIGDPDSYRYEPKEVTFFENGTYAAPIGAGGIDSQVACFGVRTSRSCALERAVHADGGLSYDGPGSTVLSSDYRYVHVWEEGFFEPVAEETGDDTVEYGLEPVAQSDALAAVSTPSHRATSGVRTAIETGEYRTSDPIDGTDELVAHDGSYYVVTVETARTTDSERRDVVVFLQWALGFVGAGLVLRGQRRRVLAHR